MLSEFWSRHVRTRPVASPASPASSSVLLAPDRRDTLVCATCGYPMVGRPTSGRCPACHVPVSYSRRVEHLTDSDPAWLLTVRRGTWLLLGGLILALPPLYMSIPAVMLALMSIAAAAIAVGTWLVTTPEPERARKTRGSKFRLFLRQFSLLTIVGPVLMIGALMSTDESLRETLAEAGAYTTWYVALVSVFAFAVLYVLLTLHLPGVTWWRRLQILIAGAFAFYVIYQIGYAPEVMERMLSGGGEQAADLAARRRVFIFTYLVPPLATALAWWRLYSLQWEFWRAAETALLELHHTVPMGELRHEQPALPQPPMVKMPAERANGLLSHLQVRVAPTAVVKTIRRDRHTEGTPAASDAGKREAADGGS